MRLWPVSLGTCDEFLEVEGRWSSPGPSFNGMLGPLEDGRSLACGHMELGAEPAWPLPRAALSDPEESTEGGRWWAGTQSRASVTEQPHSHTLPCLESEPHSLPLD